VGKAVREWGRKGVGEKGRGDPQWQIINIKWKMENLLSIPIFHFPFDIYHLPLLPYISQIK
jgi:hypothetical protein